ncbi:topoisomerase, putative [Plasmodium ovale wallikeri]|uniref:DNA topoisomerase (ATP-hydrolyzing) n=1 Tax=Plasmodium ovale wallikeri TaxID=864142 RepID=A0A1A8YMR6_PLAOA|nr:topoisomerase, putative [Plasmodium ovale wallikeri]SBT33316.1 topoisomerase, putative [Plasmodium ovale wallikeri]
MMNYKTVDKDTIFEEIEDFVLHTLSWLLCINVDIFKKNSDKKYSISLFDKKLVKLCRTMSVMELINNMILQNKSCTQREIYYKLYNVFNEQWQTNRHIKVKRKLRKGGKGGKEETDKTEYGLMTNENLLHVEKVESRAHYIIIVEKYSLYQKLCENKIWNVLPSILMTGKGFPDFSTRKVLSELVDLFDLECVYVGDYDPYGIQIFLSYKEGCKTNEGAIYSCKDIKWAGMCSDDVELFPKESLLALTKKEKNIIQNMLNDNTERISHQMRMEILEMDKRNCKFEIEAVEYRGMDFFIRKYLLRKILRKQWLV